MREGPSPRPGSDDPVARGMRRIFGANVRAARWALGLSQTDLARQVGTDQTDISEIERGTRNFTINTAVAIAGAVHADVKELLTDHGQQPEEEPSRV